MLILYFLRLLGDTLAVCFCQAVRTTKMGIPSGFIGYTLEDFRVNPRDAEGSPDILQACNNSVGQRKNTNWTKRFFLFSLSDFCYRLDGK